MVVWEGQDFVGVLMQDVRGGGSGGGGGGGAGMLLEEYAALERRA